MIRIALLLLVLLVSAIVFLVSGWHLFTSARPGDWAAVVVGSLIVGIVAGVVLILSMARGASKIGF